MKILLIPAVGVVLAVVVVGLTGCATVSQGTSQQISITSEPAGANVSLDGQLVGATPTSVSASRKWNHIITVEKEGYETQTVAVIKSTSGAVAGNALAGGPIGLAVDSMTGAQFTLDPAEISAHLRAGPTRDETAQAANQSRQLVDDLNELDMSFNAGKLTSEDYAKQQKALLERAGRK